MSITKEGMTFARIESKVVDPKGFVYALSNGTKIRCSSEFQLNEWYVFQLKLDALGNQKYVRACHLKDDAVKDFDLKLLNLQQYSQKLCHLWLKLDVEKRRVFLRRVGVASAAFGATAFGVDFITGLFAEGLLGIATGGWSLAASLGFGFVSWVQREELQTQLLNFENVLKSYLACKNDFADHMMRMVPRNYMHLEIIDPQIQGVVTRMQLVIENLTTTDLYSNSSTAPDFNTESQWSDSWGGPFRNYGAA